MICFLLDGFTSCTMPLEQSTVFSPFLLLFFGTVLHLMIILNPLWCKLLLVYGYPFPCINLLFLFGKTILLKCQGIIKYLFYLLFQANFPT